MILFKQFRQEQNVLKAKLENTARPVPVATLPPQQAPVTGTPDPNLSFYKTLPGGKGTLGTGLNPDKPENPAPRPAVVLPPPASPQSAPAHTASQPQQPAIRPPQPPMSTLSEHYDSPPLEKPAVKSLPLAASPAPAPSLDSGADPARKAQLKGKYVVQVASYQSKTEAEAVKGRLQDSGVPAYIVESVLKDKGTMYRVRVGKHLEAAAAAELAAKAGKNAIVILE
jgi:cell division protein FtsN